MEAGGGSARRGGRYAGVAFTKVHGAENDFVLVDTRRGAPTDLSDFARAVCPRRTGVGADGVLLVEEAPGYDARMRVFNADGSEPEMCGNGVRCVAAFLVRHGWAAGPVVRVVTGAGEVACEVLPGDEVEAVLAVPRFAGANLPAGGAPGRPAALRFVGPGGEDRIGLCLSMGNPHCVVALGEGEAVGSAPLDAIARAVDAAGAFPEGVNVEVCERTGIREIRVRVRERGVGETRACGTGASAAAVALLPPGEPVTVHLPGGSLRVEWRGPGSPVRMRGPVRTVFDGVLASAGGS